MATSSGSRDCSDELAATTRRSAASTRPWPPGRASLAVPRRDRACRGPTERRRERDRVAAERARTLRRLGRHGEALSAWRGLAAEGGPLTGIAVVEIAKALEHTWADPAGALDEVERGRLLTDRARALGRPMPLLEADLTRRRTRLTERLARRRTMRPSTG